MLIDLKDMTFNQQIAKEKDNWMNSTGTDPYFIIENPLEEKIFSVEIRIQANAGDFIELYWQEDLKAPFTEEKRIRKRIENNKKMTVVFDNLSTYNIKKVRIDPMNSKGVFHLEGVDFRYQQQQSVFKNREKIKINIGCGPKDIKTDWLNVDIQPFAGVDIVMDVTQAWTFKNADFIFAEHFLEHLTLEQGIQFLYNAGQSLKKGGWIRLSTPNLEWVLKSHYNFDHKQPDEKFKDTCAINRAFYGWGHRFLYNSYFLETLLNKLGYENVRPANYGKSEVPDLNKLESHGAPSYYENHCNIIIFEAEKGQELVYPTPFVEMATTEFIQYNKAKG